MQSQQRTSEAKLSSNGHWNAVDGLQVGKFHISARALTSLCLLTLCATLVAGLWPFCSPSNSVTWIKGENGIRFGEHGTALTAGTSQVDNVDAPACSVEIWVQPAKIWRKGTILVFYNPQDGRQFAIEQDFTDLLLHIGNTRHYAPDRQREVRVENVFRGKDPFITVASDGQQALVYVDGQLAATAPTFALSGKDLAGQLILANGPFRDHSWRGELKGLAVYGAQLTSAQIQQHYQSWTQRREPFVDKSESPLAAYLFAERSGSIMHNAVPSGADVTVPKRFLVVNQLRFESPVTELYAEGSYLKNAGINVAGFVPLGFVLALYLAKVRNLRQITFVTALIGGSVSVAIEYFQSYLPTRYSGVTDIVTNTAGAWLGAMLYSRLATIANKYGAEHSSVQPR